MLAAELERLRAEEEQNGPKHVVVNIDALEYPETWEPQRSDFQVFEVKKGSEEVLFFFSSLPSPLHSLTLSLSISLSLSVSVSLSSILLFHLLHFYHPSLKWHDVHNSFMSTVGGHVVVKRIERNQNRSQWTFYFLRREQVASKNDKNANEKMLYHGILYISISMTMTL